MYISGVRETLDFCKRTGVLVAAVIVDADVDVDRNVDGNVDVDVDVDLVATVVAAVVCASHCDGCNAAVAMATDARHQKRQ